MKQQELEKQSLLDKTFGKNAVGLSSTNGLTNQLFNSNTAEEQAELRHISMLESKQKESSSSSSSEEDEDAKPFKLKEALKQRRKLEAKKRAAKRKFDRLIGNQQRNAEIAEGRIGSDAIMEMNSSDSEGTVSEGSDDDEAMYSVNTDKAVIQGSVRSEKSQLLGMSAKQGKKSQSSSDSSDTEACIDTLTGARNSVGYQKMLAEQRRKGQYDPLMKQSHVSGKGAFFESNDFVKLKTQMLQKKKHEEMKAKTDAQNEKIRNK